MKQLGNFCKHMKEVWEVAYMNMQNAVELQAKYYSERHKMTDFEIENFVLLNIVNLRLKGVTGKLPKSFIGPFRVTERIGKQIY